LFSGYTAELLLSVTSVVEL